MSAIPLSPGMERWELPSRGRVAMLSLIVARARSSRFLWWRTCTTSEKSLTPPYPGQVLDIPFFNTVCLLSSSVTIWLAERQIERGKMRAFAGVVALTIVLGAIFIGGTAMEWHKLIYIDGLTIRTNLFGRRFTRWWGCMRRTWWWD